MRHHFNAKNAKRAVKLVLMVSSWAFAYNSGKRDSDLWHEQHKPGFDHYVFIRPQGGLKAKQACMLVVVPGDTITAMNDGHIEANLTPSIAQNCELQWLVHEKQSP